MRRALFLVLLIVVLATLSVTASVIATRIGRNTTGIAENSARIAHQEDLQALRSAIALDRAHDVCLALNATRRSQRAVIALTEERLREGLRDGFVGPDVPVFREFLVRQIREYDVVYANLEPQPCPAASTPERTALALAAAFVPIVPPPYRSIGGARCQAQQPKPRGGVICFFPRQPWAVGVTSSTVFVWRGKTLTFVRSNK